MIMPPYPEGVPNPTWTCGDIVLHVKPYYKYLGVIREASGSSARHFQKVINTTATTARKLSEWGCFRGKLDVGTAISILKACLMPQITYCMTSWYSAVSHESALNDVIYQRLCTLLDFPAETGILPHIVLFREFGILDAAALYYQQMMRLYHELFSAGNRTTAGKLFLITEGIDWDTVNPRSIHPKFIAIAQQLQLPRLHTGAPHCPVRLVNGEMSSPPQFPLWNLLDKPDRLCTDWRDLDPSPRYKVEWKQFVDRAVSVDQNRRMDAHIGHNRCRSSRFMQQRRLLEFETPDSTRRRMQVLSQVPLVMGARLSILNIATHIGRYNGGGQSTGRCPRCLVTQTTESMDHIFWECPTLGVARADMYDELYDSWPKFTSVLRDIDQKTLFILGCNMPINVAPEVNESPTIRRQAMQIANKFLSVSAIYIAKPTRRTRWR